MSRSFAHFRDLSGISWGGQKKPTFHEMRAVSAYLHEKQGRIAKDILGHKSQATTDIYLDSKGTKWKEIKI
jgi:integrase